MKRSLVAAAAIAALALLAVSLVSFRATRLLNALLRDFATQQTTQRSDSVYALHVGRLHVNWSLRRVTLDSVTLSTDSARNALRAAPLGTLSVTLTNCTLSGIALTRLVLGRGLTAAHFGCRALYFDADAPANERPRAPRPAPLAAAPLDPAPAGPPAAADRAFLALQGALVLPRQVPALRVGRVVFPNVAIALIQRQTGGNRTDFYLQHARVNVDDVVIDPSEPGAADRPLFSRSMSLTATDASIRPDTATTLTVGSLDINLTDSVVVIRDFILGSEISDAAVERQSPYRHDRFRADAERIALSGMDFGRFARSGSVRVRTLELDTARFAIRSDKRKPKEPGRGRRRRSIQEFVDASQREWRVDSILVRGSEVVYEEWAPNRGSPGRLVFSNLEATGTSFVHAPGSRTAPPFVLDASALFMGRGPLRVRIEVPLDARRFDLQLSGSMGPMPATALNPFVSVVLPAELKSGDVLGVRFSVTVEDGVARGWVTPRYQDLSLGITGRGRGGLLGQSGILGGIARGAAGVVVGMKVRHSNPGRPDQAPRVGVIRHTFRGESLPKFFWDAVRSGLMPVVMN